MKLPPMVYKPCRPLGGGASLNEEVSHYVHHLGNQLMVLMMRMEVRDSGRKERHAKLKAEKKERDERRKKRNGR